MELYKIDSEDFDYEHLLAHEENLKLIDSFTVSRQSGKGLENYLKYSAIDEDQHKSNRTYLVKDRFTKEIAGYFSLRNGLFTIELNTDSFYSIPAIELSNFAVNSSYRKNHPETKYLGKTIFYDFVLPLVKYISNFSGIQALYIYALPESELIHHYETLGFSRLSERDESFVHSHVKPAYDAECIFMYQTI